MNTSIVKEIWQDTIVFDSNGWAFQREADCKRIAAIIW